MKNEDITISLDEIQLKGCLTVPEKAKGLVLFAHGSGSGRLSPRNQYVARVLSNGGLATCLMDLLTQEEEVLDQMTHHLRFNIELLASRLVAVTDWVTKDTRTKGLPVGYFGASTGAAAALIAAAQRENIVRAVVSRGGRPDLAPNVLPIVKAPTLLIVGGNDDIVIGLNEAAYAQLIAPKKLEIVPNATHLFEEPGCLEKVASLAMDWFTQAFV